MSDYMRYVLQFEDPAETRHGRQMRRVFSSPLFVEGNNRDEQRALNWVEDRAKELGLERRNMKSMKRVRVIT